MPLNRPVPQSWKSQALGPGFGVNGINASGLDQHVALAIHQVQEIHFLGLCRGVGVALQGNNSSTQATIKERSIGLEGGTKDELNQPS